MADRILLCIEPDSGTVDEIRRELSPYGFGVESIPNGDDAIEWGKSNHPELIILSVEPRKVGYAICNKLKRSPSLREVKLILISSEETLATFEQHKKLKSRADEYLLKPLDLPDLLSKVDALVGLGARQKTDEMDVQELDVDADIVIADDEDIAIIGSDDGDDEDARLAGVATEVPTSENTSETRISAEGEEPASPFEGEKFDPETQAAFAALEAGSPEGPSAEAGGEMMDLRNLWSDDDLPSALNWDAATVTTAVGKDQALPEDALRPDDDDATRIADPDTYRTGETLGPDLGQHERSAHMGSDAYATVDSLDVEDIPAPEDVGIDVTTIEGAAGLGIPMARVPLHA